MDNNETPANKFGAPKCYAPGGKCIQGCRGSSMLGYRRDECPFTPPAEGEADEPTPLTDVPWAALVYIGGAIALLALALWATFFR